MNIKKSILFVLLLMICMGLLCGCDKEPGVIEVEYDTKCNIVYYAPIKDGKGFENYGFNANFYKFYLGDSVYADRMDGHVTFTVGEDATLTGTNVEALNGASIELYSCEYTEFWDNKNDYREMIVEHFYEMYEDECSSKEELDQRVKAATDKAMEYYPKAQGMAIELIYKGALAEGVTIEKIEVPSIDFTFEVDSFEIKTVEIPDYVVPCFNGVGEKLPLTLKEYSFGGTPYISEGYSTPVIFSEEETFTRGVANREITRIEASPLAEFLYIEGKNGNTHFKKDEEFLLRFDYRFDEAAIKNVESVGGTAVLKVKATGDKEYWYFDTIGIGVNEFHLMPTFVDH